jgi:hypothetical protein
MGSVHKEHVFGTLPLIKEPGLASVTSNANDLRGTQFGCGCEFKDNIG